MKEKQTTTTELHTKPFSDLNVHTRFSLFVIVHSKFFFKLLKVWCFNIKLKYIYIVWQNFHWPSKIYPKQAFIFNLIYRSDFIVTASCDGHVKFWKKKEEEGIEFVKHFRSHLGNWWIEHLIGSS